MYFSIYRMVGPSAATLAMLPVALVGWLLGMRGGILAGLFCFPLNLSLLSLLGLSGWQEMTGTGGGTLGSVLLVLVGGVLGRMSDLGRQAAHELTARRQAEGALRQAEEKYHSIFEHAVVGIFQTTITGQYLTANPTLARLYGYASPEELIATATDLQRQFYIVPNRRDEFVRLIKEHGVVSDFESQVYCKDNHVIWISENARGVYAATGELIGFEGTAIDITERKRLFVQAQERLARLGALHEIDAAIISQRSLEETLNVLLAKVTERLQVDATAVALVEPETRELVYTARRGLDEEFFKSGLLKVGEGVVGQVALQGEPIAIANVSAEPRFVRRAIAEQLGLVSYLAVPLRTQSGIIGVLELATRKRYHFPSEEIDFFMMLAGQAAIAIENARLFCEEQTRRRELGVMYDLSRALADAAHDLDLILTLVVHHAAEITHVTFARVALLEDEEYVVRAAHPVRVLQRDLKLGQRFGVKTLPICHRALEQNEPQVLCRNDPALTDLEREVLLLDLAETICLVPLRVGGSLSCNDHPNCEGHALGVLMLGEMRRAEREPFTADKRRLAHSIADQAANAVRRAQLFAELERSYLQTVLALANAVEAKDTYTADHAQRLAQMGLAVGRELGMTARELEDLHYGAILHDIGKIGVPDDVLGKSSKLDAEEWKLMRQHPAIGARILEPVPRLAGAARLVRHHHERYDGKGYPDGLAGDAIPLGARILTVVDSYSAILDERVYKAARSHQDAVAELHRCAGTQFDPRVVEIFLRLMEREFGIEE
ncbi:MAG: GAF domain-containing protein [Chloroflexi bacterium]|nr:GAF domain-containing protein [Chloroflexota bacterium]